MSKIRVGIVGCGEVAQIIHIPALQHLGAQFEITAVCDVSQAVAEGVAAKLGGIRSYTDAAGLVAASNVDAVLIANPHIFHADTAVAALGKGKDVFIEKPMCVTRTEADRLAEAERASGRLVQVGYMRRYAGALQSAIELIDGHRDEIKLVKVHDFIGANSTIVTDTSVIVRSPDFTAAAQQELAAKQRAILESEIGVATGPVANAYMLLLGLSSHDLSAMRDLIGMPRRVLHATARQEGRVMTAVFDYGHFVCEFATGVDDMPRYDTYIEVYSQSSVVRIDWDTPYVRNLPARLSVLRREGRGGVRRTESYSSRLDTFVIEWQHFYDCVSTAKRPRTGIADARQDLELTHQILAAIQASAAV